uniref:Uncharacterized protein n=1 Tax=Rhizophora mucronata TaxID=61149 RepID=A0A2P2KPL3_RHIMU
MALLSLAASSSFYFKEIKVFNIHVYARPFNFQNAADMISWPSRLADFFHHFYFLLSLFMCHRLDEPSDNNYNCYKLHFTVRLLEFSTA